MTALALTVGLLLLSSLLSLHLFLFLRSRAGDSRTGWILAGILVATSFWALFNAFEVLAPSMGAKFVLGNLQYISISALPVLQFRFGTRLLYRDDFEKPRLLGLTSLLWLEPLATSILVWLDPSLGLVRRDLHLDAFQGYTVLAKSFGPWFWFHAAYDYVLIAIGTARVILALARGSENGRAQAWLLSLAALFPSVANIVYILGWWPLPLLDPTPMAFVLTVGTYLLIFSRFRFLALLPVAQEVAIAGLQEGVLILDDRRRIVFMNEAATRLLGVTRLDSGKRLAELALTQPLLAGLPSRLGEVLVLDLATAAGTLHVEARLDAVRRGRAEIARVYSLHDITERVVAAEELRATNSGLELRVAERTAELSEANARLTAELERRRETERQLFFFSLHDPLTGLPNRSLLLNRLGQAIERSRRKAVPPYALIYADFDNFKHVNDSYGHAAGDAFLREAAARLTKAVRAVDTVARLGGDEFVVLLDQVNSAEEALEVGDRIAGDLAMPIRYGGNSVVPSASLGILLATRDYTTPEDLLRDADLAMYSAKAQGKNRRVVFDESLRTEVFERTRLTNALGRAILDGGIELHYQPIVRLSDRALVGCEALARWNHAELGRIGPDRFIPAAEEAGLIVPLGLFVLMEACRTAVIMREHSENAFIAVNVSAIQLAQPDFAEVLVSALERHGLGPEAIHLEITESALVERTETVLPLLHDLHARGFHFKLDDFGTGYSSLAYLHRFPIDTIKIDRSFVSDLGVGEDPARSGAGEGVLKGIVSLGHELGKGIVAEGIETELQAGILEAWGCDFGQGWLFGKPRDRKGWLDTLRASLVKDRPPSGQAG